MGTKEEMLELAKKQSEALLDADIQAQDEAIQRGIDNQMEVDALSASHNDALNAQKAYNEAQYQNVGQIIGDIQGKIDAAKQKDETALKRERAFRYISGLGDTLSSVANLVGTAHGAANQNQAYNSHAVVQKAEEARKARKLEMDDLTKRLDEMTARQRDLRAAGTLEAAKLKAAQDKEMFQLQSAQRKADEAAQRYSDEKAHAAMREARQDFVADRAYNAQQEQMKQTQENWRKTYNMQYAKFQQEQKGNVYNITLADGEYNIPKEKLTDANINRIFMMLPDAIRSSVKGEAYTEYASDPDFPGAAPTRTTGFKAPTVAQKLAAIAAYADTDAAVRSELASLAGTKSGGNPYAGYIRRP